MAAGVLVCAREGNAVKKDLSAAQLDVTVLLGGPSSEREVSLVSGAAVAEGLRRKGHKVTCADISPADPSALDRKGIDAVFIALHGQFGESGHVQALCEARGLRYTGSGPSASELAMDKAGAKTCFRRAGILTPDWTVIKNSSGAKPPPDLKPPLVLKPVDGGSSVDITIARDESATEEALASLLSKYGAALAERFIAGREFTVGILGYSTLPVLEIVPAREFYDYTAKYSDGAGTRYVFDHHLPASAVRWMERAAMAAHNCLSCRHMSRVDFIVDAALRPFVLEINTIPGFTGHSLLPMAAARVGIGFDDLVERITRMAIQS